MELTFRVRLFVRGNRSLICAWISICVGLAPGQAAKADWGTVYRFPELPGQAEVVQTPDALTISGIEPGAELPVFYLGREQLQFGTRVWNWEGWLADEDEDGVVEVPSGYLDELPAPFPRVSLFVAVDLARRQLILVGRGQFSVFDETVFGVAERPASDISLDVGDEVVELRACSRIMPIWWRPASGLRFKRVIGDGSASDLDGVGNCEIAFALGDLDLLAAPEVGVQTEVAPADVLILISQLSATATVCTASTRRSPRCPDSVGRPASRWLAFARCWAWCRSG